MLYHMLSFFTQQQINLTDEKGTTKSEMPLSSTKIKNVEEQHYKNILSLIKFESSDKSAQRTLINSMPCIGKDIKL